MQFQLQVGFALPFQASAVDSAGNPAKATISNITFQSSDSTIFTVGVDPTDPTKGVITAVAAGTATLTGQATATEPDGTQHSVSGAATGNITAAPPPPPPQATALTFTFGTAVPVGAPPPPPPPPPIGG